METNIAISKGQEIRKTLHKNEWWFSVSDVVAALTDSADRKQYIKKMRQRDPELSSYWGTICTPLEIIAPDGKMREKNCANTEGIFLIIQ
jgi:DNA-damage-inducible protein D